MKGLISQPYGDLSGTLDLDQPPPALTGLRRDRPAKSSQHLVQTWCLVHQQTAQERPSILFQQVFKPWRKSFDHRRKDVAEQQISPFPLQQILESVQGLSLIHI